MASKNGVTIIVAGEDKTGEVFAAVNKHLQQTREEGKKTSDSLGQIGNVLKAGLASAGMYIGLQQIVGTMKQMVQSSIDFGLQIAHMAQQTGISTQNLSALKYMSDQTGVSFETLSKGFKKISTDMFDWQHGSKAAGEAFLDLGISQKELAAQGGDLYKVLELVADRFSTMKDGAEKNAIASKLFGRAGQELIPILNQGKGAIEEYRAEAQSLGLVLDEQGIKKLEALHSSLVRVEGEVRGGSMAFTTALAPALEGIASYFSQATHGTDLWTAAGRQAGLVAVEIATVFQWLADFVRSTKDEFVNLTNAINAFDYGIGSKFNWTQKYRDEEAARAAAAVKAMQDAKADHDAMLAEEKQFVTAMKGVEDQLLHPSSAPTVPSIPPGGNPPGGGGTGGGAGAGAPASAPTGDQTGNLWLMGSTTAPLSPALAEGNARQKADAADAAAVAQQKQAADLKAAMQQMEQAETDYFNHTLAVISQIQGAPTVDLKKKIGLSEADIQEIEGEGEKVAHSIFDPLFDFNESWNKKWKQTMKSLKTDMGQFMEGQLFGALFGDPNGRGGKGWMGSSFKGDTSRPGVGSQGTGLLSDLLGSIFKKPAGVASNGGMATGAGTIPDATASLLGMGKGAASGNGGVQVIVNNTGTPQTVSQTQTSGGPDPEKMVISIFTKDLATNGPMTQGIMGLIGLI